MPAGISTTAKGAIKNCDLTKVIVVSFARSPTCHARQSKRAIAVTADARPRDLSAQRFSFLSIWGLPLVLLFSLNFTKSIFGPVAQIGVAAVLLAWMGAACTINAFRCRRLHCKIAGPVLLSGSAFLVLLALSAIDLGPDGPTYVIWSILGIVALSFLPEWFFGEYLTTKP